ncbi:MAG: T9SS type A sorting domain-containing protein [Brumimicrobium sp.]|nr:T9SS type A sorting domain-containing protein [Brumimicrobium sp.]
MSKYFIVFFLVTASFLRGQSYAPPAGQPGSTAIHQDDPSIVAWATDALITRGYLNIEDTSFLVNGSNKVSQGVPVNAVGPATSGGSTVSLGDSGIAVLTFQFPITNGQGFDFAVFENSFSDDYLEFAHVEVSTDGINYVRFPSHSEVQTNLQIHGFGLTDTRRIHNLAGKYKGGYGTPFDLEELKDSAGINVDSINYVRLIDVVGSLGSSGTFDSFGNKINEPFSTPYETGGFDLDAVGVLNRLLNITNQPINEIEVNVFPNPSSESVNIEWPGNVSGQLTIIGNLGEIILIKEVLTAEEQFRLEGLKPGIYFVRLESVNFRTIKRFVVQ